MTKVVVTENALREVLREVMWNKDFSGWSSNAEGPATVNANVDPSIAVTDPINPNFKPQDKTEFGVALGQLVKNLPDSDMPELYDTVKTAIEDDSDEEDEALMKTKAEQGGTEQVEEAFRKVVRDIINDIQPKMRKRVNEAQGDPPEKPIDPAAAAAEKPRRPLPFRLPKGQKPGPVMNLHDLPPVKKIPMGVHGGEYERRIQKNVGDLQKGMGKAIADYEKPAPDEEPVSADPAAKRSYKSTAIGGMTDVGGATLEDIAGAIGLSVAGAKGAVDKALRKSRWLADYAETTSDGEDDDLDIMILSAAADYIDELEKDPSLKSPEKLKELGRSLYVGLLDSSGELSPGDAQLMKVHPSIVDDLDGFKGFWTKFQKNPIGHIKDNLEIAVEAIANMDDFREFLHPVIQRMRKENPIEDGGEEESRPEAEAPAPPPGTSAGEPAAPKPASAAAGPKPSKASFKIYPGAKAYAGPDGVKPPAVTRVKGKVYRSGADTQFKPGEQGEVSMDGDKLKVKKPGSDHTQTWDPVEESKRPVLRLRPRS